MANPKNLTKPFTSDQSREQAAINGRKGGKESARRKKERKTLCDALLFLMAQPEKDKDGNNTGRTMQDAVIAGLVKRASRGDPKAFEVLRDTIGEKPVEKIVNITPNPETISNVEKALFGDDEN